MPQEIRLWEVDSNKLSQVPSGELNLEQRLEEWLKQDISLVSDDLLVIGSQVQTRFGKVIDLLCLNSDGDTVVIELKKDKAPRDVIAQVLEYASWVEDLSLERLEEITKEFYKGETLENVFQRKFKKEIPDVVNESHRLLIVASGLDDQSERVIKYLSEHGVNINAVTFNYFKKGEKEYLARVLLIPKSAEEGRETKKTNRLSEEQLEEIAEQNDVQQLYRALKDGLNELFDGKRTTGSSIYFYGQQEGKTNTIFSILPFDSNKQDGLKFQVYLNRFIRYFGIDKTEADRILPSNRQDWKYASGSGPDYQGYEGFFKNEKEIQTFLSELNKLKKKGSQ